MWAPQGRVPEYFWNIGDEMVKQRGNRIGERQAALQGCLTDLPWRPKKCYSTVGILRSPCGMEASI